MLGNFHTFSPYSLAPYRSSQPLRCSTTNESGGEEQDNGRTLLPSYGVYVQRKTGFFPTLICNIVLISVALEEDIACLRKAKEISIAAYHKRESEKTKLRLCYTSIAYRFARIAAVLCLISKRSPICPILICVLSLPSILLLTKQ